MSTFPWMKYGQKFGSILIHGQQPTILLEDQRHKKNKTGTYMTKNSREELCGWTSQNEKTWWQYSFLVSILIKDICCRESGRDYDFIYGYLSAFFRSYSVLVQGAQIPHRHGIWIEAMLELKNLNYPYEWSGHPHC